MIDVMFLADSLLGIKLADDELVKIETLDELRVHFRGRMTAVDKSAAWGMRAKARGWWFRALGL